MSARKKKGWEGPRGDADPGDCPDGLWQGTRSPCPEPLGFGVDERPRDGRWSPGARQLWESEQDSGAEGPMGQCDTLPQTALPPDSEPNGCLEFQRFIPQ